MHALIVEDEPIFRMDLSHRLRRLGFDRIDETAYAAESISMARADSFDLIFMDIRLKDELSGLDAARTIAAEYPYPIVVMSAYRMMEDEIRASVPTLRRFISKPLSEGELERAVAGGAVERGTAERGSR